MSGNGKHGKQTAHEYIRELEAKLYDCSANTEFCDCDKIEKGCWWYLPVSIGFVVLAYAVGFVSAIWLIQH